jgi:hypothetical protein
VWLMLPKKSVACRSLAAQPKYGTDRPPIASAFVTRGGGGAGVRIVSSFCTLFYLSYAPAGNLQMRRRSVHTQYRFNTYARKLFAHFLMYKCTCIHATGADIKHCKGVPSNRFFGSMRLNAETGFLKLPKTSAIL